MLKMSPKKYSNLFAPYEGISRCHLRANVWGKKSKVRSWWGASSLCERLVPYELLKDKTTGYMKKKYKSRLWTTVITVASFTGVFILSHQYPPQKRS